jgi:hypothetical protein
VKVTLKDETGFWTSSWANLSSDTKLGSNHSSFGPRQNRWSEVHRTRKGRYIRWDISQWQSEGGRAYVIDASEAAYLLVRWGNELPPELESVSAAQEV